MSFDGIEKLIIGLICFSLIYSCKEKSTEEPDSVKNSDPLFELLSHERTGLDFVNRIKDQPSMNILLYEYYHNGAGVATGDFDNDGLCDIYAVGNFGKNHIYKNLGDFKFKDMTENSGAEGGFGWSTGVCLIDINNDGLLDIYLSKSGNMDLENRRNELLINKGNFHFENEAAKYGLDHPGYSNQAVFFDFDKDGDLDVYIMNHPVNPRTDLKFAELQSRQDQYGKDYLLERKGDKFFDISNKAGIINNSIGFGLGLAITDFNNDSYPDIYIGNDFLEHDYLYLNNGDKSFKEISASALRHSSNFSMGLDAADFNNDGLVDIFIADMAAEDNYRSKTNMSGMNPDKFWEAVNNGFQYQYMINTLQLNNGNETFSEISQLAGVDKTDWSWASLFVDLDNDGYKDLIVTNGLRKEARNNDFVFKKKELLSSISGKSQQEQLNVLKQLLDMMPQQKISNYVFRNNADLTFEKMTMQWGFEKERFSNGAAYADFDNDGDMDIVINNIDDPMDVYKNNNVQGNYLQIELKGPKDNIDGIGTRVKLISIGEEQIVEQYNARGYLSSVDHILHFGINESENVNIEVFWPDGKFQSIENVELNNRIEISHKNAGENRNYESPLFEYKLDKPYDKLKLVHNENEFDDYKKQVLLPHKMSQFGPAFALADINGDGLEDFFLGASVGANSRYFIQNNNGFEEFAFESEDYEDVDATFFDFDNDGDMDLYVLRGGNEYEDGNDYYKDAFYINKGNSKFELRNDLIPDLRISGSCVVAEDYDKDGDLDLFIGGRHLPGKYPSPVDSYLLINTGEKFEKYSDNEAIMKNIGMVTDADFFDYDLDGDLDILIVGEWMPVTILIQNSGEFDNKVELPNSTGWWNCIKKADLDGDGDLDFVLGNLGRNIKYHADPDQKFHVYAKDFDSNGHFDIVLSKSKGDELLPVRGRQCSSEQLPEIKQKFPSYDQFARANVEEIYSREELESAIHYEADNFNNSLLMNQGKGKFNLQALPNEAQISAVEDVVVKDFNKDRIPDLLLAGNLEETEVETPRSDASYGTILINNGSEFISYNKAHANLTMFGNVRHIREILIAGQEYIFVVRNNGPVEIVSFSEFNQ